MAARRDRSLPEQITEDLLVCRICYGRYTATKKLPKMLSCSHTFCELCIAKYVKTKPRKNHIRFPCPLCRAITPLSLKDGPAGLANNFTVLDLLDIVCRQEKPTSPQAERLNTQHQSPEGATAPSLSQCSQCENDDANFALCCHRQHIFCEKCYMQAIDRNSGTGMVCPLCSREQLESLCPENANHRRRSMPLFPTMEASPLPAERPPPYNPEYVSPARHASWSHSSSAINLSQDGIDGNVTSGSRNIPPQRPPVPARSSFRYPARHTDSIRRPFKSRSRSSPLTVVGELMTSAGTLESSEENPPLTRAQGLYSTLSPPRPPPRRASADSKNSPLKCVQKIGRYSEVRMQTKTFRQPTRLAVSEVGSILVVDSQNMTLQLFTPVGDYISLFKVTGIRGACFLNPDKLVTANHRGVEVYTTAGDRIQELPIGPVVNVVPYRFGFIACRMKSLAFYRASITLLKEITRMKTSKNPLKRGTPFERITDVGVTSHKDIVVLDAGVGDIYIINEDGHLRGHIQPGKEICGKLNNPQSLTVDKWNGILVSDTDNHRVLKFSAHGTYSRCLLSFDAGANPREVAPYGLRVSHRNEIVLLVYGKKFAELRWYQM